ncbi:type-F conjugative transfer system protein TraW [Burkholderia cenocepacia]|uniref:Type-F conjugative transfer system protein TraW n=1 Tax=Burkholderia cenocepacia TaxID=95486 RepID=A0A1V2VVT1_9BURK|nr:type-F conjugative transfer system protein TraW [Burkholderia cenocepacia]ONU62354.1 type-F conjugative transfer system protein TraW [Burkholderia cenocepacia]ONU62643.1 type-F conjugative transfer system protein TraW [Burkholderia cenocepacia]ONU75158.1 type-F conjugative transfer system protein TraW [Burkholderia cenocepacia]ONU77749.1 type-F conjugative transfer system protein TraW [Burkholderia cenocepacia]ONU95804.1 type-F conjugative transfer system protein TraW [Burkholderia cenocepa
MRFSKLIAVLMAGATLTAAHAESLGTIGQTYPIGEESALTMIMNKLRQKERSGELKKLQQEAIKRSMNSVKNMPPVDGLQAVTEKAQRLIDPTVYYPNAVKTDEGRIVVPAGAKINPLLVTGLSKRLVFFDGRDPDQAEAVRRMVKKEGPKVKPILVAGSWLDLTKAWKTQVYFDQKGVLSQRFGIHAVPTVISQQGASLLLQEVPAKELQ